MLSYSIPASISPAIYILKALSQNVSAHVTLRFFSGQKSYYSLTTLLCNSRGSQNAQPIIDGFWGNSKQFVSDIKF